MINRSFGAELAITEMISARSLVRQSKKTERMLESSSLDRPLGVQLLGNEPDTMREALDLLRRRNYDLVDFNAACPVTKVVTRGEGAALLREPRKLRDILSVIVRNASAPVTVKIRSGWDEASINAPEVAAYAEDAGVRAIFIHGRTKMQGYSGTVDYRTIRLVREKVRIPVIASGDALSPALVVKMFGETGCDGVVIARGSLGNPWIFRETKSLIQNDTLPPRPDLKEIAATMSNHLALCCEFYGEETGTIVFRKFFAWYTKGLRNSKPLREKAFHATSEADMSALIDALSGLPPDPREDASSGAGTA
jgi:tRNA-dihydrouridine synthase B